MDKIAYNLNSEEQMELVKKIFLSSPLIRNVIEVGDVLNLDNYYIGAGCLTQTVWNSIYDRPYDYGIKDIDIVYFDEDISFEAENLIIKKAREQFSGIDFEIDIKNQARVHIWYKEKFGNEISPYTDLEEAIRSWPTTATAIGIRKKKTEGIEIYAPFGLEDLLSGVVRANKKQITEEIFYNKVKTWQKKWPELEIVEW